MKKLSILVMAMLMVMSMAVAAFAADFSENNPVFNKAITENGGMPKVANDSDVDNNVYNANLSGVGVGGQAANFNEVIKSDNMNWKDIKTGTLTTGTQRTHGEYQNNTNSCASCHQTHTAAAKDLLFKNSAYNTCTACHDGTLGFYNVFQGSTAGTFGGTADGNASMHLASGALEMSAAPGGNRAGNTDGLWNEEFACNSCHTPHGSFSDRLLHFDPNGMANVVPSEGGQKVVSEVYTFANKPAAVDGGKSIVVKATYDEVTTLGYTGPYATNNALYNNTILPAYKTGANLIVVLTPVTASGVTSYKIDTTPWFHEYEFDVNHNNRDYATSFWVQTPDQFKNGEYPTLEDDLYSLGGTNGKLMEFQPKTDGTGQINIDFQNAFAWDTTGTMTVDLGKAAKGTTPADAWYQKAQVKTATIARVIIAKLPFNAPVEDPVSKFKYTTVDQKFYDKTSYASSTAGTTNIPSGTGINISKFCAACHTDYFSKSGELTGMFGTQSYRHNTLSDSYMCLRCHFAHGTDVTVMTDSMNRGLTKVGQDGKTAVDIMGDVTKATAYLLDQNPSSALKRYTNMAVCWKCHTSSHAAGFRNTDYFKTYGFTGGTSILDPKNDANPDASISVIPNGY